MAEIAAIGVSLISPAIELGKVIVSLSPIKHQFNYLCCFTSNIQSLKNEAEKLKNERDGLQMRVDTANRNIQVIVPKVNEWLDASNQIQVKTSGIQVEIENVKRGCFAIKSRFSLSRKAKKTAEAMKDLRESCNFEEISVPAPPASMASIRQGTSDEFESRKQIEKEIMKDLRGRKVHMMGICGMGGVGKTTMAKKIMNRVREENVFEEVVMVVISQKVRMLEIQSEIAEKLGLTLREESLSARADRLHARLKGPKKSILLILDDVWEGLNLEDLGIPCKRDIGEGCTIMLTSRNRDVLSKMDAIPYAMTILFGNEAWSLFREKVGTWVDDSELLSIAKEVERECKGLPLALIIVGTTLKNEKSKHIWEDALLQLKSSNPTAMPDVLREVYKPLKLSYDFLDNPDARSLFLLCCLFPEDRDIPLEYLTMYGMGLRMFDGIMSVEEARNGVRTLFKMLKGLFLLLDGRDGNHVRMHDVVRDVAIFIASEEGRVDQNLSLTDSSREESINCIWISVAGKEINKLSVGLSLPSLHLLLINYDHPARLDITFFKGMTELNVLSFRSISLISLPETTPLLKKLRTLYLEGCTFLKTIAIVGELLSLEILICRSCPRIEELPAEIGRLERLKLLEVSHCKSLRTIAPGVISNLVQLEELVIVRSFDRWKTKANGEQRDNAALCELEHLKNLTRLQIEIRNATLATEEIRLSSKIVKYDIELATNKYLSDEGLYERKMSLTSNITFGKWIQVFLTSTEYLYASGEGAKYLDIAQAQKMKKFILGDCSNVNKLVNITTSMDWSVGVFPLLESLKLYRLSNLEEICDGPIPKSSNSFRNLKELNLKELPALRHLWKSPHQNVSLCNLSSIHLWKCDKLRKLFPLAIARDGLSQLQRLTIRSCSMMEEVFSNEENENDGEQCHRITFPKLYFLDFGNLPKLQSFCNWRNDLQFPSLEYVNIFNCRSLLEFFTMESESTPNLKTIHIGNDNISNIWGGHIPLGFFRQLQALEIVDCNSIRNLFSYSIALNLVNLKQLTIYKCNEMVKVIEDDEEMFREKPHLLFPCLNSLSLSNLPKLQSFCNSRCDLHLPSLEYVRIDGCHLLEFFTMKSVKFGSVKKITIRECNIIRSLFSSSIAENLVNLEQLDIWKCNKMVQVIENDEDILFSSLKELKFGDLPKLESFCNWRCDLQLISLQHVSIIRCPLFKQFSRMGSITTPNLKSINIDYRCKGVGDLNSVIQLHFNAELKKYETEDDETNEKRCAVPRMLDYYNEKIEIEEDKNSEESTSDQAKDVKDVEVDHNKAD